MRDPLERHAWRNTTVLGHESTIRDQVLALVRHALVTGGIAPGGLYSASALADRLGVSTSPVREAMSILVNEGLLEPVRNRGFRVVEVSESELEEIYDLRRLLEIPAVIRVAQQGLDDQVYEEAMRLARRTETSVAETDLQGFLETDRQFHLLLLAQLGNRRLLDHVAALRDQSRLYGLPVLAAAGALRRSADEHVELLEAIYRRDPEQAEMIISRHLGRLSREWATGEAQSEEP